MMSQMHLVQNAARLAMADHRAAVPRRPGRRPGRSLRVIAAALAALLKGTRTRR